MNILHCLPKQSLLVNCKTQNVHNVWADQRNFCQQKARANKMILDCFNNVDDMSAEEECFCLLIHRHLYGPGEQLFNCFLVTTNHLSGLVSRKFHSHTKSKHMKAEIVQNDDHTSLFYCGKMLSNQFCKMELYCKCYIMFDLLVMVHSHQIICSRLSDRTAKNWVRYPLLPTV